ncbi:hypothetical protein LCGC14_2995400, partial [marine sediment metagenome]
MKVDIENPSSEVLRFERTHPGYPRTSKGLAQFQERESKGTEPEDTDPYYLRLCTGKAMWEWTVNDLAGLYRTIEWPGWLQLELDFKDDPRGLEQIAKRVGVRKGHLMKHDLKHSNEKQEFSTGAQRDSQEDKSRPDLISCLFLDRLGTLLGKGAKYYGERNWEKGMPLSRFLGSAMRHLVQTIDGQEDEDHAI